MVVKTPVTLSCSSTTRTEPIFISAIYALVGIGAILFPVALWKRRAWATLVGLCWTLAGLAFFVFGAFNFFSHIGLIVETTPKG